MPIVFNQKIYNGGDIASAISKFTKYFKAPGQMFKGQLHVPGMNFAGPGIRLDLRLNDDLTPKEWSKPIDRVDETAYLHDLAYEQHTDTPSRNIADEIMVKELDSIENPTLRERAERAFIKPIIATKDKFGLGVEINTKPYNGFVYFQEVLSKKNPP